MAVLKYKSTDGTYKKLLNYSVKSVTVVQEEGNSEENVMSQKATTDALENKLDKTVFNNAIDDMATNTKINEKIIPISDDFIETLYHQNKNYVDLGLPSGLLWATCNIGASKPEENGLYFAWGETQGYKVPSEKGGFSWGTYKFGGSVTNNSQSKYNSTDGLTVLEPEDDAAHVIMGGDWRMPTVDEFRELRENTVPADGADIVCGWINNYNGSGINGILRKSRINGNTIFFPAAGFIYTGMDKDRDGVDGYYWSSSISNNSSPNSYYTYFNSSILSFLNTTNRCNGLSIRGVMNGK